MQRDDSVDQGKLIAWLGSVAALVFIMVIVGGLTRLTESGLSMVDWRPVTGWLPPLSDTAWDAEFAKYQATPEFAKKNSHFTVSEFKQIFWLEYIHRVLGRLIGVAFAIPFFVFLLRKRIPPSLKPKLWIALALGGLQGFMGWYMVKSGLVDRPSVSQYRLAAHLGLAVFIYGYFLWIIGDIRHARAGRVEPLLAILAGVVFVQILLGAFVAGLDAGTAYPYWPELSGNFFPADVYAGVQFIPGAFEDHQMTLFNHRLFGYGVFILVAVVWFKYRARTALSHALAGMAAAQMLLGILTVIYQVPIAIAVTHQAGALVLFSLALLLAHQSRVGHRNG